jgi:hypothetical protein
LEQVESTLSNFIARDYSTSRTINLTGLTTLQFYTIHILAKDSNGKKSIFPPVCIQTNPHYTGTIQCKSEPGYMVTTVAGVNGNGYMNGSFSTAQIGTNSTDGPFGIVVFEDNLYMSTTSLRGIMKVDMTANQISIVAGSTTSLNGSTDALGTASRFSNVFKLTADLNLIYAFDRDNYKIRSFNPISTAVSTFAGNGANNNNAGTYLTGGISVGIGILFDGNNTFYATVDNHRVRQLNNNSITTLAGDGTAANTIGILPAQINAPSGVTVNKNFLYVGATNGLIRQIDLATNTISTIASRPGFGFGDSALYGNSLFIVGGSGTGGVIYKLDLLTNQLSVFAGSETINGTVDGNRLTTARIDSNVVGIVFYGNTLYFTQRWNGNSRLRKIE